MDNYDLDPLWCDAYVCRVWTVPGSPVDSVFQLPTWLARPLVITLPTLRDLTSFLWRPLPAGPGSTGNKKIRSQLLGVYNLRCASLQSSLDHLKFERQKLNLCHREVKTRQSGTKISLICSLVVWTMYLLALHCFGVLVLSIERPN